MPVQQIELEEMIMDELSDLNDEVIEKLGNKNPKEASSFWVSSACCGT
jgi:hypothetical protein